MRIWHMLVWAHCQPGPAPMTSKRDHACCWLSVPGRCLRHKPAAIDVQGLARDVADFGATEHTHERCNLFYSADPSHRSRGTRVSHFAVRPQCVYEGRSDAIDGNAVLREVERQRLGQSH